MEMDQLRSCYKSYMRLYPDRPDVLTLGRWYWCLPGAQTVPYKHAFASSQWDPKGYDLDVHVGEVARVPGWVSGATDPRNVGRRFCGTAEAWLGGIPYADRPGLELGTDGLPICCHYPQVEALELAFEIAAYGRQGDSALELSWELEWFESPQVHSLELAFELEWDDRRKSLELAWELEWFQSITVYSLELAWELEWTPGTITVTCGSCTEAASAWTLTISGLTGGSVALNGTWRLAYRGSCAWASAADYATTTGPVWIVRFLAGSWRVQGQDHPGGVLHIGLYVPTSDPWNCTDPNTVPVSIRTPGEGWPDDITVDPA
jgi:hypothetical protein